MHAKNMWVREPFSQESSRINKLPSSVKNKLDIFENVLEQSIMAYIKKPRQTLTRVS